MAKNATTVKASPLRETRVRELLDAACHVVAEYDFQGATIGRVAKEAKIAKGTISLYCPTKEDLLTAAPESALLAC